MINFIMTNRACKKTSLPLRDRQSFSVEREKNTMDKLHVFQIITFLVCIICRSQVETHEYFFFQCPFTAII